MEEIAVLLKGVFDLGFPVTVAIYLLYRLPKHLDRLTQKQMEHTIGLYLILDKLDLLQSYEGKLDEFRKTKKEFSDE